MSILIKFYKLFPFALVSVLILISCNQNKAEDSTDGISGIKITDHLWGPRFDQWRTTTVNDIFDKFEGRYNPNSDEALKNDFEHSGATRDAFKNFDLVAQGK